MTELSELMQHDPETIYTVRGKVANTPSGPGDPLFVTIPAFDGNRQRWGPCDWLPQTAQPMRGDDCLVVFDEQETPWVLLKTQPLIAKLERGSPQLIPAGAWTSVAWDVEDFDYGGLHAAGAARIVAPAAGVYSFETSISWETPAVSPTGMRAVALVLNAAVPAVGVATLAQDQMAFLGGITNVVSCGCRVALNKGDYVGVGVFHSHTAAINVVVSGSTWFQGGRWV